MTDPVLSSERAGRYGAPPDLISIQRRALMIGGAGFVVCAFGAFLDPGQFFRSYLVAFLYWLAFPIGCFAIVMLHHLSGGVWGLMIRRILEAASRTLPLVALFFVPVLIGLKGLYPWARPETVKADLLLQHQAPYLNPPFFLIRAAAYFIVWGLFSFLINRISLRQDHSGDPSLGRRMQRFSGPGLALYGLAATFASIDWLMSLNPHWYSTIFGFYFVGGQAISAISLVILTALFLSRREPMSHVFRAEHFHDYGKLLLTVVVLWAYFAASQLIIIWQGNLAEEVPWYQSRLLGGWRWVSLLLVLLHFALPFVLLLSRDLKRNAARLASIALVLLVMRWVDLYWLAAPAFFPQGFVLHWLDLVAPVALGGLWVAFFVAELRKRPLLPVGDPGMSEALVHG